MIFGTVGTDTRGFDRLVRGLDEWARHNAERVVIQIGGSSYEPRCAEWFRFTSADQIESLIRDARVVVMHAGAGSLLTALDCGRSVLAVPRLASLGEVIDDHQVELCEALEQAGLICALRNITDLDRSLGAQPLRSAWASAPRQQLIATVAGAVAALVPRRRSSQPHR